jgi:hypothetical protein
MNRFRLSLAGLALLALLSGCQRLRYDKTVTVDAGNVQTISIDPPRSEQKVHVSVKSPGVPLDVYVVLDKDLPAIRETLLNQQRPEKSLASKMRSEEADLDATIPAKNGFSVLLTGAQKANSVQVKVTGG